MKTKKKVRSTVLLIASALCLQMNAQSIELHLSGDYTYKDSRFYKNLSYWVWGWDLKKNIADGNYIVYQDSSHTVKYLTGIQHNGRREGEWTYYHINGLPQLVFHYSKGEITGDVIELTYSGDTLQIGKFRNGECYHITKWNYPYNYELPSEFPEFTNEYSNKISVSTYYDRDGHISQIDSHNYNTNTRHDCFYDEDGSLTYEYFDTVNFGHHERSVVHHKKYNPDSIYSLGLNLQKSQDWKRLDSLSSFPQLQGIYINWIPDSTLTEEEIERLNKSLLPLLRLKNFTSLSIHLRGRIPDVVFELTDLTVLEIHSTESLDSRIGNLVNLESLEYWYFGDYRKNPSPELFIPRQIKHLQKLYRLNLTSYVMQDPNAQLKRLKALASLRVLMLNHCGLNDFPESLTHLKQLHTLLITGGPASYTSSSHFNSLPESFRKLKNLRRVTLPLTFKDSTLENWRSRMPLTYFEVESICFTGETEIAIGDGTTKSIDMIQVGDIVVAYDMVENKIDTALVTHVMVHNVPETNLVILQTDYGNEIHVTPNHPIWTSDKGYIPASMITPESKMISISTGEIAIESALRCTNRMIVGNTVYNFGTTKGNYFANGILVHNK